MNATDPPRPPRACPAPVPQEPRALPTGLRLVLLALALAAMAVACTSCTVIHGTKQAGGAESYTYATVGGDARGYVQTASGVVAEEVNSSASFRELAKTARFGIGAWTAKGIASDLVGAWKANTAMKEATRQAGISANATTEQARIAAEAAAAAPEAAAPAF